MTDAVKVKHKPCPIILASTSRYRADLLRQLNIRFTGLAPAYEESDDPLRLSLSDEPEALACHHALQKAISLSVAHPAAVIIGSDQTGSCNGTILHKPGTREAAHAQLAHCSGREALFHTATTVLLPHDLPRTTTGLAPSGFADRPWYRSAEAACAPRHHVISFVETTTLTFRTLTDDDIEGYLELDQPFDCAGSFKVEAHGIGLFSRCHSNDPSALIGLPLIGLANVLTASGFRLFKKI